MADPIVTTYTENDLQIAAQKGLWRAEVLARLDGLDGGGDLTGIVTSVDGVTSIADGAIGNAKLTTNPLARANHTGTQAASTITGLPVELTIALGDETTAATTGTSKVTFRAPFAFTLTAVRASCNTAPTGGAALIDINEAGVTVLSTKLMIDATEKTSVTATTPYVISDAAIADDAEISFDMDQVGSTVAGAGYKVTLYGTRL